MKKTFNFRKLIALTATVFLCKAVFASDGSEQISILVNEASITFDQSPIIENDRVLVPFRAIFEALGAAVDWDEEDKVVTAIKDDRAISMQIDNPLMTINGSEISLDAAPKIVNDRTLVPVRAVSEGLGAVVKWDDATRTVSVKIPLDTPVARIEITETDNAKIEYVQLSGMTDIELQDTLNDNLKTFYSWPLVDMDAPDKNVTTTAKYAIIGNKYISARYYGTEYAQGAAYPVSFMDAIVYDLETGEFGRGVYEFINPEADLKGAIQSGLFVQTYPDTEIEGATDILVSEIVDNPRVNDTRYYLTEDSIGLFVDERIHAQGDYWTFEAKYSDVKSVLSQKLLDALDLSSEE